MRATCPEPGPDPVTGTGLASNDGANASRLYQPPARAATFYKAAVKGKWKLAKQIIEEDPTIKHAEIMRGSYTALQVAAGAKQVNFVKKLVVGSTTNDLGKLNANQNNAFIIAASAGSVQIAKLLLKKDPTLLTTKGNGNNLPLYFAAFCGQEEMVNYLYAVEHRPQYLTANLSPVFFACIESGLFGFASTLLESHHTFATQPNSDGKTALHLLAQRPSAFTKETAKTNAANKLLGVLLSQLLVGNLTEEDFKKLIRRPSHVLFDAVKSGNSEFVVKLIDVFPGLIWETNERNWTIIHAAVSHRDATIFNLVHEMGFFRDVIVDFRDNKNGDTLLHLAARLAPASQLHKLPGAAFQMQRELLWFEKVKKTMHAAVTEVRNVEQTHEETDAAYGGISRPEMGSDTYSEVVSAQHGSAPPEGNPANADSPPELSGDTNHEVTSSQLNVTSQDRNLTSEQQGTPLRLGDNPHQEAPETASHGHTSTKGRRQPSNYKEGKTPRELFTFEHELLLKEGRKWMNGTAKSCTIVSTLIAGALFAAGIAVTVGENSPKIGSSDIFGQKLHRIFLISNAMAFLSALAATLTFLAILTSRYAERDFLLSLPMKLIMGLGLLFLSIVAMMVAFITAFFIAYGVEDYLPRLVIGCSIVPLVLYLYPQFSLLKDIFKIPFEIFVQELQNKLKIASK